MPIYEYRCEKCGEELEVMQKISEAPLQTHEGCGGGLSKLVSHSSFQLKGSGWYATDYGRGNSGNGKTPKSEKSEKSETKAESKTESKPAACPSGACGSGSCSTT